MLVLLLLLALLLLVLLTLLLLLVVVGANNVAGKTMPSTTQANVNEFARKVPFSKENTRVVGVSGGTYEELRRATLSDPYCTPST